MVILVCDLTIEKNLDHWGRTGVRTHCQYSPGLPTMHEKSTVPLGYSLILQTDRLHNTVSYG